MRTLLLFGLVLASALSASAAPFVVIVRHAEKANNTDKDPNLSAAGLTRAEVLAQMLKDSAIEAIYITEFKRTAETAAPAARALGVTPTTVPAKDTSALVDKLRAQKKNALVVGHGNSIPDLIKALGIDAPINIPETDYDQILVVDLGDTPQLLRLRYPNGLSQLGGHAMTPLGPGK
jgi:broad specificity phosphatase PhoE